MAEIVDKMKQNEPSQKLVRTRSSFPLQYQFYDTMRFGELHPHFVMEGVSGDKIRLRSSHDVRSYTLKAPLMADISMKKDYFNVPMTAILPNNWQKFFANPVVGNDVPDDCGPACENFYVLYQSLMSALLSRLRAISTGTTFTDVQFLTSVFRFLVLGEYVYSNGSLMSSLGIHAGQYFEVTNQLQVQYQDFDQLVDAVMDALVTQYDSLTFIDSNGVYREFVNPSLSALNILTFRDLLQYVREDPAGVVNAGSFSSGASLVTAKAAVLNALPSQGFGGTYNTKPLNFSRISAYQLVSYHYYTNDNIDFVFSAQLYRQLMWYYFCDVIDNAGVSGISSADRYFTVNGLNYDYDSLSGHCLFKVLSYCIAGASSSILYNTLSQQVNALSYLAGLFGYRRSLRFKDYFTGSRSQPLAVADSSFDASNTSVIDITKNIQRQRFLNAVNRIGARWEDYMANIFGHRVAPDFTNPFYLGHTSDVVFGSETENTGAAQQSLSNSVTSALRSNGSRYEFTVEPDRDCVIIGLTYFDIPRAYSRTIERQTMHLDRFDMFNPFMQFVGDQEVYPEELNNVLAQVGSAFAYQLRHMEYKQRYNQVAGGFVHNLPAWSFIADRSRGGLIAADGHVSSDYIRSLNSELDQFYVHLTGWSLGSYFHFIVKNTNDCTGSRPMAYAPSIL